MFILFFLIGCERPSWFITIYDRDYYEAALLRWEDNDGDGQTEVKGDCDDSKPAVFLGADEVCNGVDDDCDTLIDFEPLDASAYYQDQDGDGRGNEAIKLVRCSQPNGYATAYGDCDDEDPTRYEGAVEICGQEGDPNCDGVPGNFDKDQDGHPSCADCNEENSNVNPAATETCNGIDDNCDGIADGADAWGAVEWRADNDGDDYGAGASLILCDAPGGWVSGDLDCDDENPDANPGVDDEVCGNGFDDNCDGDSSGCRLEEEFVSVDRLVNPDSHATGSMILGTTDLTGDGYPELLISTPSNLGSSEGPGAVLIVEGPVVGEMDLAARTVAVIEGSAEERFGFLGVAPGDLDGDGAEDWIFVAYNSTSDADAQGGVYVMPAGVTGGAASELATAYVYGTVYRSSFGSDVVVLPDTQGDGLQDLVVAAPNDPTVGEYAGAVYGFVNAEGALSDQEADWKLLGEGEDQTLGAAAVVMDWNGDGVEDLVVTASGENDREGAIYPFMGPIDSDLVVADAESRITGEIGSRFGAEAVVAGDTDLDGLADLWVTAYYGSLAVDDGGDAFLFTNLANSGAAFDLATAIFTGEGDDDHLGMEGSFDAGDLDLDGIPDVLFGASSSDSGADGGGKVWLHYGPFVNRNTITLADAWWVGREDGLYGGGTVKIIGDLDVDGNVDFAFTQPNSSVEPDYINIVYGYSF